MELYLNSSSDYSITDDKGNTYSLDQARDLYDEIAKNKKPFDCNLAFGRLVAYNFDLDAVKQFHQNMRS